MFCEPYRTLANERLERNAFEAISVYTEVLRIGWLLTSYSAELFPKCRYKPEAKPEG